MKRNAMSERLKSTINIPVWAISIIITLLLAAFGFTYSFARSSGQANEQIQDCRNEISKVQAEIRTKADDTDMDRVYNILERIENKLDQHISTK